jgi:hypothetical protein
MIASGIRGALVQTRRFARSRQLVELNPACRLTEHGDSGFHTFFGYHDVSPFSHDDRLLLGFRTPVDAGTRTAGLPLELGCFDLFLQRPRFEPFALSMAWCWQQGCRLQWYPLNGNGSRIVFFNVSRGGRHESCLFDVDARVVVRAIARPLYALSPDGKLGVSVNFSRLQRCRPGYGYNDIPDATAGQQAPSTDGLWLVNLLSGAEELIFPLAGAASRDADRSMLDAEHYFNHVLWNPSGTRFLFLHLWKLTDGSRLSRAFIWDVALQTCWLLGPRKHVSHHCWLDDEHLIVYATEPQSGTHYHVYHYKTGYVATIGVNVLKEDGHPSMSPTVDHLMITDTYPDRFGEQSVLLFDMQTSSVKCLARLYRPARFRGEVRCDLHPRWNRAGDRVAIDSAHSGERRLCVIDAGLRVSQRTATRHNAVS